MTVASIDGESDPANDVSGTYGTLDWAADGTYTYNLNNAAVDTLQAGEVVTETFTYTVSDGNGGTDTETLTITITGTNDPVVAVNDTNSINEGDSPIAETDGSGSILSNDTDADDDDVLIVSSIEGESDPGNDVSGTYGTLNWNTDGTYTYILNNAAVDSLQVGEVVTEDFAYIASDQQGSTDDAT